MPTYYIDSGDLHCKIEAENPKQACIKAFQNILSKHIVPVAPIITVNEQTSRVIGSSFFLHTDKIIEESGLSHKYNIDKESLAKVYDDLYRELGMVDEDEVDDWWKQDE